MMLAAVATAGLWSTVLGSPVQLHSIGTPGEFVADLNARRARTMAALGAETMLVLWSAPPRVYSADIDYPYRQESSFFYLTGIAQPDTVLVLLPGARSRRAIVFAKAPNAQHELWSGHLLTPAEITSAGGIETVIVQERSEQFDRFIDGLLSGRFEGSSAGLPAGEVADVIDAVRQGRARLAVVGRVTDRDVDLGLGRDGETQVAWARAIVAKYPSVQVVSAAEILLQQRRIKTPYEQRVLRRSVQISAEAHLEAMRATRAALWEYQIKAVLEHGFLSRGAMSWGYPPIVGSGPNATTLHYLAATRQMQAGDLLLVDAAGSFQGLTGDITRTWPVGGRFTSAQRAIYDVVLRAQDAGIAAARPGRPVSDVTAAVRQSIAEGLASLGFLRASGGPERDAQVDLWYPHGPVHGIGLDVHEPIERLDVGSAFVIEPGIYIRPDAFDRLPPSSAMQAYAEAVRPLVDRYRNIGIRVEDSFLMTPNGPEMLSRAVPRRAAEVEAAVGSAR
ncbi:MAG: aminopeptidase P N-terminal domain-containing protein [Acidobacteria bacterium]|nr:aminopeptidase P N-terminal domain-containing protein [Acidobacteriota bacterium]